jgi:ribosomal-protein-alanine N-acetyltransferase
MRAALPFPTPPLTDGVVILRAWNERDVRAAGRWGSDAELVRWSGVPGQQSEQLARAYMAETEVARRAGLIVALAIADADNGALVGACDVRRPDPTDPAIGELGYLLVAAARGRGVATRAVWLLVDWSFRALAMQRLQALVHPENPASARVLQRLGFTREGRLRRYRTAGGAREDRMIYSLLPGELAAVAAGMLPLKPGERS